MSDTSKVRPGSRDGKGAPEAVNVSSASPDSVARKQRLLDGRSYVDTSEQSVKDVEEAIEGSAACSNVDQMISFVATDIQDRIRKPSIPNNNECDSLLAGIRITTPSCRPLQQDSQLLDELESQARKIAAQIDRILLEFKGCLSGMSKLSVECSNTYANSVKKTCDSVDNSIKTMYQLMAKAEELLSVVKSLPALAKQVREIKRVLDLFDSHMQKSIV